jgi:3-methylcrotonyl-CoA carboxylase alpha subunit
MMPDKILIANRGEIAVRIARACHEVGMAAVMVYSEADRFALHVRSGDEACYIGESPASDSYLRGDRIIEAALATGCRAIHPGYGFLAENAKFAADVIAAGLIWIGPQPSAISLMGSKIESKRLAEATEVPIVPGYFGDDQTDHEMATQAGKIGFPVLVKASAGGGGKGMRVVATPTDLNQALLAARREAAAAFGDDSLMLEKYLEAPRHIEVQVLGDLHGNLRHFGERDCTIQRRHQKVVEESPSPVIDATLREAITTAAVKLAAAAKYSSAGTVEFIFQDGEFYFLEMNTRIQVEHPVTEEALGVDLVHAQIRIAFGESLNDILAQPGIKRHAIEARLYAEDPTTGFLPSTGRVTKLLLSISGADVRVDAGVAEGDDISPFYDPMIAKIIASGPDRLDAIISMRNALNRVEVEGPKTNLPFLKWLFAQPDFVAANFSTRFIEQRYTSGAVAETPLPVLLAASYHLLTAAATREVPNSALQPIAWRHGRQQMPLKIMVAGTKVNAIMSVDPGDRDRWTFNLQQGDSAVAEGPCTIRTLSASSSGEVSIAVKLQEVDVSQVCKVCLREGGDAVLTFEGIAYPVRLAESLESSRLNKRAQGGSEDSLASPMPGKVLKLLVNEQQEVEDDQPLAIIEAMKMEFTIKAPHAGRIARITFPEGSQVAVGDILIEMESAR